MPEIKLSSKNLSDLLLLTSYEQLDQPFAGSFLQDLAQSEMQNRSWLGLGPEGL